MSGLYIHIPFCKKKCHYCSFYSTANLKRREELTKALCAEMAKRKDYTDRRLRTVYMGGGTPSLLDEKELKTILTAVAENFDTKDITEQTIEANPDDITPAYADMLIGNGFNRISVGIQTFDDSELRNINRRHTARQALESINTLKRAGFGNISIDLMFGLPLQTAQSWKDTLQRALELDVQHISAYSLSYEENTVLWQKLRRKELQPTDENLSVEMFRTLTETLTANGFEHYEISNFAKEGFRSKHNSSYWNGTPYIGIGPSAHSYDGDSRQWNISDIAKYIDRTSAGLDCHEKETLSTEEKYNDFVITRLRTCEGIDTDLLKTRFGNTFLAYFANAARPWIASGKMVHEGTRMRLANDGIFISDTIFSDLIYV